MKTLIEERQGKAPIQCQWVNCTELSNKICYYWGEKYFLCTEHSELVGDYNDG